MALDIAHFTGTTGASTGTWPYGYVKNNPSGTLVDVNMVSDLIQLAQRLMVQGSVTPNNLLDNADNTFQLYTALIAVITATFSPVTNIGAWVNIASYGGNWGAGSTQPRSSVDGKGRVSCQGNAKMVASTATSSTVATLPSGSRPSQTLYFTLVAFDSSATPQHSVVKVSVDTSGAIIILDTLGGLTTVANNYVDISSISFLTL